MNISVAILAGGLATRLRPLTQTLPKAMIEIEGKPFLAYQLELLKKMGLVNIVLCVGYEGQQIETYFGKGEPFGVELHYSYDGATLLGTGGALQKAFPLLDEVFLVLYGDSYLPLDYLPIVSHFLKQYRHDFSQAPLGLMTVYENNSRFERSNVHFSNGKIRGYDKQTLLPEMKHIDWGLGIFSKKAFVLFEADTRKQTDLCQIDPSFDLAELYQYLVSTERLLGLEVFQRFYEIGSPSGLQEFREYIQHQGAPSFRSS